MAQCVGPTVFLGVHRSVLISFKIRREKMTRTQPGLYSSLYGHSCKITSCKISVFLIEKEIHKGISASGPPKVIKLYM